MPSEQERLAEELRSAQWWEFKNAEQVAAAVLASGVIREIKGEAWEAGNQAGWARAVNIYNPHVREASGQTTSGCSRMRSEGDMMINDRQERGDEMTDETGDTYYRAYHVNHEAWYGEVLRDARPDLVERSVTIQLAHTEGGVKWEFEIVQEGTVSLRLKVFDDAWVALTDVPDVFAALAAGEVESLTALVEVLDGLGFRDITERERTER